jgi:hypothetical protein
MIDIITQHLLEKGDFCGSPAGRRLSELRWKLLGVSRHHEFETDRLDDEPHVTRMVTLPVNTDNAITTTAEKAGVSRNQLIEQAIEVVIAANRA